jgi:metal-responsive CopG/Arc/MetJ family transcriptional regulator
MTVRTTITLEEGLYVRLKELTSPRGMNRFINNALREKVHQLEQKNIETLMKEGYLAMKADRAELSADWQAVDTEGWPE